MDITSRFSALALALIVAAGTAPASVAQEGPTSVFLVNPSMPVQQSKRSKEENHWATYGETFVTGLRRSEPGIEVGTTETPQKGMYDRFEMDDTVYLLVGASRLEFRFTTQLRDSAPIQSFKAYFYTRASNVYGDLVGANPAFANDNGYQSGHRHGRAFPVDAVWIPGLTSEQTRDALLKLSTSKDSDGRNYYRFSGRPAGPVPVFPKAVSLTLKDTEGGSGMATPEAMADTGVFGFQDGLGFGS